MVVGKYPANAFGLHDMHGNVREWCEDHWRRNYTGAPADGSPWYQAHDEVLRVVRGGGWDCGSPQLRSAFRERHAQMMDHDYLGFRVARQLAPIAGT